MTPRMRQTLDFIENYHRSHRMMPTITEIADALGIRTSRAHTHNIVSRLVDEGYLLRIPGRKRNLAFPGPDLDRVPTDALRAELSRREVRHG